MTILLVLTLLVAPSDTLRLEACYREAAAHHPLQAEGPLHDAIARLNAEALGTRLLPDLSLRGQATYQSDVPSFPLDVPGFALPVISKDQYRVSLDVEQVLYDGGLTRGRQALEYAQRDVNRQAVAVSVYGQRARIDAAFFGVLVQQAHGASLDVLAADLRARRRHLADRVAAGLGTPDDVDRLDVELLRVAQQQAEVAARRRAALDVLGVLLGRVLPDDTVLAPPRLDDPDGPPGRHRPEYAAFDLNRTLLRARERLAARQTRPRLSGFAEAAYGRPPGLDIFENSFQPFWSVGLRMQWGFWDWRRSRREREALTLQRQLVDAREAAFAREVDLAAAQQRQDIVRLEAVLERDDEIIRLQERLAEQAARRLENGVLTATDYLLERNAAHQARLTRALHELQLLQARVQYRTTTGTP